MIIPIIFAIGEHSHSYKYALAEQWWKADTSLLMSLTFFTDSHHEFDFYGSSLSVKTVQMLSCFHAHSTTLNLWELHCATLSVHVEWLCSLCCSLAWLVILSLVYTFTFIVQNWGHSREHNRNGRKWAHLVWVSSYCYHANNMFLYFYFLWPCSCSGQQQIKHQNSRAIDTRAGIPACLPCVFCWNWYMLSSAVCGAYSRLQLYCAYGFSLSYALCKAGQYHFVLLKFSELI